MLSLLLALAAATKPPQNPLPREGESAAPDAQGERSALDATPQVAPAPGPATAPEVLNGVYLIVNEEVVTLAEFYRELRRRGKSVTNEEERRKLFQESHADFVRTRLMTQAGRDLGFDAARVDSLVDDDLEGFIEDAGSASAFGEQLKASDLDAETLRAQRRDFYFREFWLRSIDGRDPGVSGRPYVDRFVRPGRMLYLYRRQPIAQLFPSTIQLQAILVSAAQAGSAQKALDLAKALRERALGGEDFGALAETYSADGESRRRKGLLPKSELARAREAFPDFAEFIDSAAAGAISEPSSLRVEGELVGFLLMRVAELERRDDVDFTDRDVQRLLRERDLRALGELRRDLEVNDLYRAAYIWPPEARVTRQRDAQANPSRGPSQPAPQN
ncbi:MAG: hypothetical protein FJ294_11830 [Planctomycetes bacterium]|nr:hypothetical protein [Planctomycetota bacterium]